MSEERNALGPPISLLPPEQVAAVNPLAPDRTAPEGPLAPTGAPRRWALTTPTLQQGGPNPVDWDDEQLQLRQRVSRMWNDMPAQVRNSVFITSGFRTKEQQDELHKQSLRGEIRRAAPAGGSLHEQGLAADWHFGTPEAMRWLHQNAPRYGLAFPFADDAGHMQTIERTANLSPEAKSGFSLPGVPAQYRQGILDAAYANRIDPRLLAAVVQRESQFNPSAGANNPDPDRGIGLGQLKPGTARDMGVNPADVNDNLMGAGRYLRMMFDDPRVQGDPRKAVMLYNTGPKVATPFQNVGYANDVMNNYQNMQRPQYASAAPAAPVSDVSASPAPLTYGPPLPTRDVGMAPGMQAPPTGQMDQGPTASTPGQPPTMGGPGILPQPMNAQMLAALAFSMSARRITGTPVSYDPWAVEQMGRANPNIGESLRSLGTYTTRIGRTVPGPA